MHWAYNVYFTHNFVPNYFPLQSFFKVIPQRPCKNTCLSLRKSSFIFVILQPKLESTNKFE